MQILKARSKPRVITVVQFRPGERDQQIASVRRDVDGNFYVDNRLHNSKIKLRAGDYVRIDDPNDNYPIDHDTFHNTYELVDTDDPWPTHKPTERRPNGSITGNDSA